MRIDWFLYHVASGHAFFTGLALILAAIGVRIFAKERRRAAGVLMLLGVLLVAISATPLPWATYGAWAATLAAWAWAETRRPPLSPQRLLVVRAAAVVACVAIGAKELPFHVMPRPVSVGDSAVGVIGDSVTAGMGENEAITWPQLLADRTGLVIHDHSAMGATVASARKQAAELTDEDRIVIVEIGGNDLLGSTTLAGYESGLDALLGEVSRPDRTVVMFELPLPPGFNAYGLAQRRLAAKHGAVLIPKRALMGVFTGTGATLDSIHLSQAGHERMAGVVAGALGVRHGSAIRPDRGERRDVE